jgi:hypothetical protein
MSTAHAPARNVFPSEDAACKAEIPNNSPAVTAIAVPRNRRREHPLMFLFSIVEKECSLFIESLLANETWLKRRQNEASNRRASLTMISMRK